jgi:hypothetical protein
MTPVGLTLGLSRPHAERRVAACGVGCCVAGLGRM